MVAKRLIGGRGSAAFHERLVLQDAVGQPLQVDALSKRDPVAWRVRIPSGQGLARHANAGGGRGMADQWSETLQNSFSSFAVSDSGSDASQVFAFS
jgi:hypothetical protein